MKLKIRGAVIFAIVAVGGVACQAEANRGSSEINQATIEALIEQLGAAQYAHREKAREELHELGVVAFESLHAAQSHADVEIRKQAAYLLRSIRISWVQETDSEEVRRILGQYESEDHGRRLERLQQLSHVENETGVPALCRLARFETSEILSKRAALAIMQKRGLPIDAHVYVHRMKPILGASQRPAVRWLNAYAQGLIDPAPPIAEWILLCQQEIDFVRKHPDKQRRTVLYDLLRWHVELLHELSLEQELTDAMSGLLAVQGGADHDILGTANWLLDLQAWQLFDQLVAHFSDRFAVQPRLRYCQAEAMLRRGQRPEAEAIAEQVLTVEIADRPFLHVELGYNLQMRGLIDWAEREFRHVIENSEISDHVSIESSIRLGWMFHDLGRHQEAYQAYRPLVESMDKDNLVIKRRVQELSHRPETVRGQMHFSRGLYLGEQQKYAQQRVQLEKAIQRDQENADILIAMYRIPDGDKIQKEKTHRMIDALRGKYENKIANAERDARRNPSQSTSRHLAQQLNQFAWLVSNTYGDYQTALKNSQRSLQLIPDNGGYLDTLARCYFAIHDLDNAIKHQRRAVRSEPHSGQISRQLDFFESQATAEDAS